MPSDLNFNSVLAVFLIKDPKTANYNVSGISNMLAESGIEIVSLTRRELDYTEAVFLQSRIVESTQKLIDEQDFNPDRRSSRIKNDTAN